MNNINSEVAYGTLLSNNYPPSAIGGFSVISLSGEDKDGHECSFKLSNDILSKHVLLIGSTGTGKTNLFYHMVNQLKSAMSANDVMLIFDSKGDFYDKFFSASKGDIVIGSSLKYRSTSARWSIYEEVISDGYDRMSISQNIREICKSLFADRLRNTTNSFFPNAALDVLSAIMTVLIRDGIHFSNSDIREILDTNDIKDLREMFSNYKDLSSINTYIDSKGGAQTLGIMGEVYSVTRDIFTGVFAEDGNFSMRKFIRNKKGRTAFLEYDLSIGDVLSPVYTLLFDLALKEALGRTKSEGNVYLIADELKLLPNLRHLDDGINFGRSLGVKIFAGLQSINQLKANYTKDEEARAVNIIAGFSSIIAFRASDFETREYISNLFGKNIVLDDFEEDNGTRHYETRNSFIVEDWDILQLRTGEAVIGLPENPPFKFKFKPYGSK